MNAELIPFPRDESHFIARFNHVKALGTAFRELDAEWTRVFFQYHDEKLDYGTEAYIRAEVRKSTVIKARNEAERIYRAACDEFFFAPPRTGEGEAG